MKYIWSIYEMCFKGGIDLRLKWAIDEYKHHF